MKVLQINAVYGHGSTGDIVRELLLNVKKVGGQSYIAVPEKIKNHNEVDGYIRIGNKIDYKLHSLSSRIFGMQGFSSKKSTLKLIKEIEKINPDIIHLHNLHSNYINIEYLFKYIRENKKPTIITLHDCWFLTGKCCHFLYDNCEKWKVKCEKCIRKKKEIPSYFFDTSTKVYEKKKKLIGENPFVYVIGCSKWITEVARQSILNKRVIGTIYNGIDLSIFYPRKNNFRIKYKLEEKYVILGMANKWLTKENEKTYEEILKFLKKDIILFLIGCTEEEIKKLPDNVLGVGFINDKNTLADYYSMADVFVNVTKVDSLPTVNIEAIACGTPVITYNSGGSAEILNSNVGISVEYGDIKGLILSIEKIKTKRKEEYIDQCVKHINENFEKNKCFEKYIDLYEKILSNEV